VSEAPGLPAGAGEQRELVARLRAVIEAKDTENAVVRGELIALRDSFAALRAELDAARERERLLRPEGRGAGAPARAGQHELRVAQLEGGHRGAGAPQGRAEAAGPGAGAP
jgi:hypothetical protein